MIKNTTYSICEAFVDIYSLNSSPEQLNSYVQGQINRLPDFIKFAVTFFHFIFYIYTLITSAKSPANSTLNTRVIFLLFINRTNFPILSSFYKYYHSLIILRSLEDKI